MKLIIFLSSVCFFCFCCTTKKPIEPIAPEFDFLSSNYFTPNEISTYKGSVKCSEVAYWEGKTLRLQGYMFSGNINATGKRFFLYENVKVFDTSNRTAIVHFQSKDSLVILQALRDNSDKHCIMKVRCFTEEIYIEECLKVIKFTIMKPEDLEFK